MANEHETLSPWTRHARIGASLDLMRKVTTNLCTKSFKFPIKDQVGSSINTS
jgi:hypothetical protein